MEKLLEYKGILARITYCEHEDLYTGTWLELEALPAIYASSAEELNRTFQHQVDSYYASHGCTSQSQKGC